MSARIPVTVVSGFLGSGKTTLLNRLLASAGGGRLEGEAAAPIVVIVNEIGAIGLDHAWVRHIGDRVVLVESGCICCTVRGELVDALRNLFLDALHRKMPAFSRVLIETTGIADPAPIIYTLQYERFLSDRYAYDGCISVVDGVHGAQQLRRDPVAVQQAVLADALVISKTDLAADDSLAALEQALSALNPGAPQYLAQDAPALSDLLRASSLRAGVAGLQSRRGLWGRPALRGLPAAHGDIEVLTMTSSADVRRPAFIKAMSALLADTGVELLRVKGMLWFEGDSHASAVHAVHRQLYPIAPMETHARAAHDSGASVLVLIFRAVAGPPMADRAAELLPEAQLLLSSGRNFAQ